MRKPALPLFIQLPQDPRLPVEEMLVPQEHTSIEIGGSTEDLTKRMSAVWEIAR